MNPAPSSTADDALVARLTQRVDDLAELTEPPAPDDHRNPGVTRMAFTQLERDAHALVADWARADGAQVETDEIGNTICIYRPGEPYLMIGSHVDSVWRAGRYDGIVGVVAALEVANAVKESATHGLRVVVFSAEEGARFGLPCLGSSVATGALTATDLGRLEDGKKVSALDAAREIGLDPGAVIPWAKAPAVAAFLELHIEQGSVLEDEQVPLGIVDVIAGAARVKLEIQGTAEHSGATPMRSREDALAAAAEIVLTVETIGRSTRTGTATIGHLVVEPNGVTTIPGTVTCTVDIRNADAGRQRAMVDDLTTAATEIADRRHVICNATPIGWRDPVMLYAWVRRALGQACAAHGPRYRVMTSGAGHDAALVAMGAPAGMLFVATPNGLSHVPEEECRMTDVVIACHVLCKAMITLDGQIDALPDDVSESETD